MIHTNGEMIAVRAQSRKFSIRTITTDDYPELCEVDAAALLSLYKIPAGTKKAQKTIRFYHQMEPSASFVAEIDNRIGAYLFARAHGSFACIGPMGVLPQYRQLGIGHALVTECIEHFWDRALIGLEAMSERTNNIGFYEKQGFHTIAPTWLCEKNIEANATPATSSTHAKAPITPKLRIKYLSLLPIIPWEKLRALSSTIIPGLDFQNMIEGIQRLGMGDTVLLFSEDELIGFATVITFPLVSGARDLQIKHLVIAKPWSTPATLERLITEIEILASQYKKRWIITSISSLAKRTYKALKTLGYHQNLRFMRMAYGDGEKALPEYGYHAMFWGG